MAGTSLFALIDDIASILDDVSVMTKTAAQKTSGVLGDDLALNAQQVSGVSADRELPVVWAVAKGSFVNKLILVPGAFAVSLLASWLISPLLMAGGTYLCFEGMEKVLDVIFRKKHSSGATKNFTKESLGDDSEAQKIKGAIRTDFVLSAEIIVIALGTVVEASWSQKLLVLTAVALLMTIGVYGFVAVIVKLDDLGLLLCSKYTKTNPLHGLGALILKMAPLLLKGLGIAGTVAMFMVGGGIIAHNISWMHAPQEWSFFATSLFELGVGVGAGLVVVGLVHVIVSLKSEAKANH